VEAAELAHDDCDRVRAAGDVVDAVKRAVEWIAIAAGES
jgi:hypothetical protein